MSSVVIRTRNEKEKSWSESQKAEHFWTIFLSAANVFYILGCSENVSTIHPFYPGVPIPFHLHCGREVTQCAHLDFFSFSFHSFLFISFSFPSERGRELTAKAGRREGWVMQSMGRETPIYTKRISRPGSEHGHFFSQLISLSISPWQAFFHADEPITEGITHSSLWTPHLKGSVSEHLRGRRAGPFPFNLIHLSGSPSLDFKAFLKQMWSWKDRLQLFHFVKVKKVLVNDWCKSWKPG